MRKSFILLVLTAIIIAVASCSKADPFLREGEQPRDRVFKSTVVTIDEAEEELSSFLEDVDLPTRGNAKRTIESRFSTSISPDTRSDNGSEPLIHVFNFADDMGYAIMSGDRRVSPVLCIADSGHMEEGHVIDNPGQLIAMSELDTYYRLCTGLTVTDEEGNEVTVENYAKYLPGEVAQSARKKEEGDTIDVERSYSYGPWEEVSSTGSIIGCNWNQSHPFNDNCTLGNTTALAGCVPIAVAQIMYYWGKSVMYKGIFWDWTKMREIEDSSSAPKHEESWTQVKQLIRILGSKENLDADYGVEVTLAEVSNTSRTFKNFGFTDGGSFQGYNYSKLTQNLANGPALGSGYSIKHVYKYKILGMKVGQKTWYTDRHVWVFDKTLYRRRHVNVYSNGKLVESNYDLQRLVHINWGDGYKTNGYYLSTRFDANEEPITRGTTTSGVENYYQFKLQMNCNIRAN